MAYEGKVVVNITPEYLHNEEEGIHAARIQPLGITAYGRSEEDAAEKIKRMFAAAVNAHRANGALEEWLNQSGLEWNWFDKYEGDTPVEDVEIPMPSQKPRTQEPVLWNPSPSESPSRKMAPAA